MSKIKCSLLVVDDEPSILETLSNLLCDEFDVRTANSAELAKSLFTKHQVDLILSDERMPNGSGVELLQWVRDHSPNTVRLLMTGFAELERAVDAINKAQVFCYIFKPWNADELLETIRKAARNFVLEREREHLTAELRRLNQELEVRVQQRTEELEEANHELEQKNKMLEKLALTDPLTGLPNRRAMDRLAERELRRRERHPSPICIGLVDVDHFKNINSQYLLPGGDKVLVDLAKSLASSLRTVDFLGRIGGEEFLVIAPDTDEKGAESLAERVRSNVESTKFYYKEHVIAVTVSVGFACAAAGKQVEFEHLKHLAASAMEQAKREGRNRCVVKSVMESGFDQAG